MDPHHQGLLVVTAVKNPDAPALRQGLIGAPEVIVIEVQRRGGLKGRHLAALGIHPTHHMLDRSVLARGVHRLKDQQHRPLVLGIKTLLQLREHLNALLECLSGRLLVGGQIQGVARIDLIQPESIPAVDSIGPGEVMALREHLAQFPLHRQPQNRNRLKSP